MNFGENALTFAGDDLQNKIVLFNSLIALTAPGLIELNSSWTALMSTSVLAAASFVCSIALSVESILILIVALMQMERRIFAALYKFGKMS